MIQFVSTLGSYLTIKFQKNKGTFTGTVKLTVDPHLEQHYKNLKSNRMIIFQGVKITVVIKQAKKKKLLVSPVKPVLPAPQPILNTVPILTRTAPVFPSEAMVPTIINNKPASSTDESSLWRIRLVCDLIRIIVRNNFH